jgi:ABC-type sulfate transport system substrate-binding protein
MVLEYPKSTKFVSTYLSAWQVGCYHDNKDKNIKKKYITSKINNITEYDFK